MSVGVVGLCLGTVPLGFRQVCLVFFQQSGGKEPYYDGYVRGQSRTQAIHGWPGIRDPLKPQEKPCFFARFSQGFNGISSYCKLESWR